ncbi:hypothetical protein DL767_010756 [Monosporascus sp. MG133]|nr:hypothetical protein DL767_010756 [Monosporascus sp. MG133]
MELSFLLASVVAVLILRTVIKRILYPRPLPGIPYNKESVKRVSGDHSAIVATYEKLTEWSFPIGRRSLDYGSPIHQLFLNPFAKPYVLIDDPREVSDIILRRNKEFDKTTMPGVWQTLIPNSTIAKPTTEEWKSQRRAWQDTMHPDFLRRVVAKNIYAAAVDLTTLWAARCAKANESPVDVRGDFSFAALDAIWTATFGDRLQLNCRRGALWPAFSRWRLKRNSTYRKYMEMKDREIDRILRDASARFQRVLDGSGSGEEHDTCAMDLVLRRNMLAAQKAGMPVPDPTKDANLRDELLLFIYAGHDTTSTTLQWWVKFMTNNQQAQSKLRETLRAAFGSSSIPSVEALTSKDIPYLNATIEETLRCAGTASRLVRVATTDTEILGHKIPAGTEIAGLTAVRWQPAPVAEECRSASSRAALEKSGGNDWVHQPSAQDLDKFVPERWLKIDEMGNEIFDSGSLPQNAFGGGTRGCFGRRLAMMELRIMITLTVISFKFLPVPPELNSFQAKEELLRSPHQCFVKLETA